MRVRSRQLPNSSYRRECRPIPCATSIALPDAHQAALITRNRAEQDGVHHREESRQDTDADTQRDYRDAGKSPVAEKATSRMPQVVEDPPPETAFDCMALPCRLRLMR